MSVYVGGTTGWKPFRRELLGGNGSVLYLDGGDGQLPAMTDSKHRRAGETGVLTQSSGSLRVRSSSVTFRKPSRWGGGPGPRHSVTPILTACPVSGVHQPLTSRSAGQKMSCV